MNEIFLIVNCIYLIAALLQLLLAPRVGPNPYFGFRIGYTFSSKRVWKRANRFMGILMTLHAVALFPITEICGNNWGCYLSALLIPIIVIAIIGIIYASHTLEVEKVEVRGEVEPVKPLEATFAWKYFGVILFLILISMMLIAYPSLPNMLATHFDAAGNPNGWSTKNDFYLTYILFALGYLIFLYFIIYAGKKYPIALHSGLMKIGKDTVFKSSILSLNIVFFILMAAFLWIYFYNASNINPGYFATTLFLIFTFAAAFVPVGYIIYRWRKEKSRGEIDAE